MKSSLIWCASFTTSYTVVPKHGLRNATSSYSIVGTNRYQIWIDGYDWVVNASCQCTSWSTWSLSRIHLSDCEQHWSLLTQLWMYEAEETARLKAVLLKARRYAFWLPFPWRFTGFQWWVTFQIYPCITSTPPTTYTSYNHLSRGHGLTLSVIPSEFMRKNFVNCMLFNDDIYWCFVDRTVLWKTCG